MALSFLLVSMECTLTDLLCSFLMWHSYSWMVLRLIRYSLGTWHTAGSYRLSMIQKKNVCQWQLGGFFFSRTLSGIGMKKAHASFLPETKINLFI